MIVRSLFLGVALCGGLAQLAAAHEFDLLLLAPDDATGADLEAMRAAFLIAARGGHGGSEIHRRPERSRPGARR